MSNLQQLPIGSIYSLISHVEPFNRKILKDALAAHGVTPETMSITFRNPPTQWDLSETRESKPVPDFVGHTYHYESSDGHSLDSLVFEGVFDPNVILSFLERIESGREKLKYEVPVLVCLLSSKPDPINL